MSSLPARLRLRHKLLLTLLVGALLPVAVASTVALRLVLSALESGVQAQTQRTLEVAQNIVLENVKRVFESASRVAENPRLADQLGKDFVGVDALLASMSDQLPAGLLVVADDEGRVIASHPQNGRLQWLMLEDGAPPIRRALGYERRVWIETAKGQGEPRLVVRAALPVVDDQFHKRGALVLAVPLDAEFADTLKAQVRADVVVYAGEEPVASSFIASDGRREAGFPVPESLRSKLQRRGHAIDHVRYEGRAFAAGFARLLDQDGKRVGAIAVANDEEDLVAAKARAWRSLVFGAALAGLLALVLAAMLSVSLTRPLARLHAAARAAARGDLGVEIRRETGDEIGDLADALRGMTRAVRENQERLDARMREMTTLHDIGRAVSSVLAIDEVLRQIVNQLAAVLAADKTALLFATDKELRVAASVNFDDAQVGCQLYETLFWWEGPLLLADVNALPDLAAAAKAANVRGSLLAVPLEQKDDILGLLVVTRERTPFTDNDLRLVATFADQAATAIQNARLYEAVQRSSEDLERKVVERTAELTDANRELARLLEELKQAQAQLVLSERMAGLGFLVAGIAHEVNSPAGAIQGAIDTLGDNVDRLVQSSRALDELPMSAADRQRFLDLVARLTPQLASARVAAPAQVRRQARELSARLRAEGLTGTEGPGRVLAEIGAADHLDALLPLFRAHGFEPLVAYLEQHAYLHRNVFAIRTAVGRIRRIVGALKGYSHLDQAKVSPADLHEGIENTLIILHHELSHGILIVRKFAELPSVPVYVDELNQVWTNLIQNAAQALGGQGEITVETRLAGDEVEVAIQDNGPGIPSEIIGRIFEPFFTTKKRGQGTGLGLGIVRQIIDKHGGRIDVTSRPGCTRFTVRLPVAGPLRKAAGEVAVASV